MSQTSYPINDVAAGSQGASVAFAELPLLRVENLRTAFFSRHGREVFAVDGVSFDVRSGEAVGVVG